jgi:hypothetical protein
VAPHGPRHGVTQGAAGAYKPEMTGSAQRILHHAVVEKLVIGPDGTMVPLTPGSTRPAAEVRRHAGLVPVEEWTFHLP